MNKYKLIKMYLDRGVYQNKIIITQKPSVCNWSLTKKCLVGENNIEVLEVVKGELTYKNNRLVSLLVRTELTKDDVNKINNSDGIIITDAIYGNPHYRYGFIPTI